MSTVVRGPITKKRSQADKETGKGRTTLLDVRAILEQHGYSPAEAILKIATKAASESTDESYEPAVRRAFLDMSLKANTELLQYVQPKLTRSEHTGANGGPVHITARDMTDDQLAVYIATLGGGGVAEPSQG